LFGIAQQEASNPSKELAYSMALGGRDTTLGLMEVSVTTGKRLVRDGYLLGPRGTTALVLALARSPEYSIKAGTAAYHEAMDIVEQKLPSMSEGLRRYCALAIYNRGAQETVDIVREQGLGAFHPKAVQYICMVRQYQPPQEEMWFWALVSDVAQLVGVR
jgi:hypothetical protein